MGKSGGCAAAQIESIGRLISLGCRSGIDPYQFVRQLKGISCHSPIITEENKVLSCADAIAKIIEGHLKGKTNG
jgi:ribonucleoside-diphosphate reductase alpha chain